MSAMKKFKNPAGEELSLGQQTPFCVGEITAAKGVCFTAGTHAVKMRQNFNSVISTAHWW